MYIFNIHICRISLHQVYEKNISLYQLTKREREFETWKISSNDWPQLHMTADYDVTIPHVLEGLYYIPNIGI